MFTSVNTTTPDKRDVKINHRHEANKQKACSTGWDYSRVAILDSIILESNIVDDKITMMELARHDFEYACEAAICSGCACAERESPSHRLTANRTAGRMWGYAWGVGK